MRRLSFISLILLVGAAAAPQRALAQAGTPPPAQTPAQPAAASPTAADDTSRSLFDLTDREFLIGGRFTSIDGDPARFQRYQDVRDGLLFSGFRYAFTQPDGNYTFHARANNVGYRDQEHQSREDRADHQRSPVTACRTGRTDGSSRERSNGSSRTIGRTSGCSCWW
jgi:hypothetical protein